MAETFRLADKHGVGVDIHLHDRHEAGTTTIKEIIRLTKEYGLQDKVFISHAFGLNDFIGEERAEVYDALAAEKFILIPACQSHLIRFRQLWNCYVMESMFILVVTISTIAGLPMVMVHYKKNWLV